MSLREKKTVRLNGLQRNRNVPYLLRAEGIEIPCTLFIYLDVTKLKTKIVNLKKIKDL